MLDLEWRAKDGRMEDNETLTIRRVVVGVDDSPNARLAVEHATRRVGPEGQLIVAHVMRPVTDPVAKVMPTRDEPWTVARHHVDQMAETPRSRCRSRCARRLRRQSAGRASA